MDARALGAGRVSRRCVMAAAASGVAALLPGDPAWADRPQQLSQASRPQSDGKRSFSYRFSLHSGRPVSLAFTLSAQALGFGEFKAFDSREIKDRLEATRLTAERRYQDLLGAEVTTLVQSINRSAPSGYWIEYRRDGEKLSATVSYSGRDPKHHAQSNINAMLEKFNTGISELQTKVRNAVTAEHARLSEEVLIEFGYVRDRKLDAFRPDYYRYSTSFAEALAPAAGALLELGRQLGNVDSRALADLALAFVQSIPYDTLTSRTATASGAGFATPVGLLVGNRGDCDTKAACLAALLRTLIAPLPVKMVLVPGHALIAAALKRQPGDDNFFSDQPYILAEVTGFAPFGRVAATTLEAILSPGKTTVLTV